MAYSICNICGKLFQGGTNSRCPECDAKYHEECEIVREYVRTHPGSTPVEINMVTGISVNTILRFLDDGFISCANN